MKRSTEGSALAASRKKKSALANKFFDDGLDLSEIATELNNRRFRQENGKRLCYKNVADLLEDKYFI